MRIVDELCRNVEPEILLEPGFNALYTSTAATAVYRCRAC
jgi:hypothetical protein